MMVFDSKSDPAIFFAPRDPRDPATLPTLLAGTMDRRRRCGAPATQSLLDVGVEAGWLRSFRSPCFRPLRGRACFLMSATAARSVTPPSRPRPPHLPGWAGVNRAARPGFGFACPLSA